MTWAGVVEIRFAGGFVEDDGIEGAALGSVIIDGALTSFEEDAVPVRVL